MKDRQLILHTLCAPDIAPVEFVRLAAENQCEKVTLFTFNGSSLLPPSAAGLNFSTPVNGEMLPELLAILGDTGISVDGVEFFPLTDDVDVEIFRPALVLGRELGAIRVSTHIFIKDDAIVVDKLGKLCDLANAEGLKVSSEFCPMTPGNPSLARAKWLVDQIGTEKFGIGVDSLHLIRSGATVADIEALDPSYFGIVQINDAFGLHSSADYIKDVHNREPPGFGDLPLRDFVRAIPTGRALEIEVPATHRRKAGVTAAEHVRDCVSGTRVIMQSLA